MDFTRTTDADKSKGVAAWSFVAREQVRDPCQYRDGGEASAMPLYLLSEVTY